MGRSHDGVWNDIPGLRTNALRCSNRCGGAVKAHADRKAIEGGLETRPPVRLRPRYTIRRPNRHRVRIETVIVDCLQFTGMGARTRGMVAQHRICAIS
jgi:hypothetical protein